jgi:serine/threonine protein kinase
MLKMLILTGTSMRAMFVKLRIRSCLEEEGKEAGLRGSPLYMAPEIILRKTYDAKGHGWSVSGILLHRSGHFFLKMSPLFFFLLIPVLRFII